MKRRGRPEIPAHLRKDRVDVYLEKAALTQLDLRCQEMGLSRSDFIAKLVRNAVMTKKSYLAMKRRDLLHDLLQIEAKMIEIDPDDTMIVHERNLLGYGEQK